MATVPGKKKVLVVGEPGGAVTQALLEHGFAAEASTLEAGLQRLAQARPDAVVLEGNPGAGSWAALRAAAGPVPLLVLAEAACAGELEGGGAGAVLAPGDTAGLVRRLEEAVRGPERSTDARLRAAAEIGRICAAGMPLEQALQRATVEIGAVVDCDRCSLVLVDPESAGARVVASHKHPAGFNMSLNLAKYPELRRAMSCAQPVLVGDALCDPLMARVAHLLAPLDVRSLLAQPLLAAGEVFGALLLRQPGRREAFGPAELDFTAAAAALLAVCVRDARLQDSLGRHREELESAYVDRYRELVEANRRLKSLAAFKDKVIGICSHDLRGPLNVLLGHGRLLAEAELERQDAASVQAVLRQANKLLDLIETLLDRSRGESAQLAIEPEEVDLAAVCREVAAEHEIIGAERGVSIEVCAPDRLELLADPIKLRQGLQNLVANSIGRAPEGGNVRIELETLRRPDGDSARVVVSDDGPPIPLEELPSVFELHRRADGAQGLSICRELIELQGGEVWAEARPDGTASFVLVLPISDVRLPNQNLNPGASRPRVLLVEDEPEVAAITAEILRSRYRVDIARDGAEAIARARARAPDLILMDVFLPRVDGLDAAATLKAAPDTRDIPVILVSAHRGVAEKVRALNLGAVDYISKPFQAADLLARIDKALAAAAAARAPQERPPCAAGAGDGEVGGLLDRTGFLRRFAQELGRARRYGRPLSLVSFAPVSALGPERAASAAGAVRASLRRDDLVGHLGPGRFLACLPQTSCVAARAATERLAGTIEAATGVAVRTGVIDAAAGSATAEALLESALEAAEPEAEE